MKTLIKSVLRSIGGEKFDAYMTKRVERHNNQFMAGLGVPEATEAFIQRHGYKVQDGPFQGMEYIHSAVGSALLPKLVGSYECELHDIIKELLDKPFETVADVGCAEGYYAVGFAAQMSRKGSGKVFAHDINPDAQTSCAELAAKNNAQKSLVVAGRCSTETLQQTLKGRSLVICDCEGFELHLLDPNSVPVLRTATILVELHDQFRPGLTPELTERFRSSHHIQLIDSEDRDPDAYPLIQFLSPEQRKVAVSEFRQTKQQWAYMIPLTS